MDTFLRYDICEGDPKKPRIYLQKILYYSYMFKLQSPSKYSPFDAIHLSRHFFHCSEQFLNLSILMPSRVSAIFCFTSSTSAKCFPLKIFFIWRNKQKNSLWGEIRWIGRLGHGGHVILGQKLMNIQHSGGRCTHKSPIMKWANTLILRKKFTEAKHSLS